MLNWMKLRPPLPFLRCVYLVLLPRIGSSRQEHLNTDFQSYFSGQNHALKSKIRGSQATVVGRPPLADSRPSLLAYQPPVQNLVVVLLCKRGIWQQKQWLF
ncbi:hypothetical protein CsSME_00052194 [Camellia sinensis var. sinensis]